MPNSLAAWLFQDANRGVELRRMANKFLLFTWWFWQTMITLPYTVRVGTSGGTKSLIFETIPNVVKFLSSEESDYMYSESQMDVALFASMLNINIHIFQNNRVNGRREGWTPVHIKISSFSFGLLGLLANTTNAFISSIRDTTQPLEKCTQEFLRQCSPSPVCHLSYVTCHMAHVQCQMTPVTEKKEKWEELVGGLLPTRPTPSSF